MKSKYLLVILLIISLSACKKDAPVIIQEPVPVVKSDKNEIVSFKFLKSDNSNLNQDNTISIDQSNLKLTGSLPFKTELKNLTPTIEVSPKATISPSSKTAINLESPVEFTVTAEDGTISKYELTVTLNENEEAKITSFSFLSSDNNDGTIFGQIHEDIIGEINDEENTIVLAVPTGTAINELVPTIETSEFSTIAPESKSSFNFSQPITYTVTSQTGNEQEYQVSLTSGLKPDRQLLMELDALNPNNTLGWDFSVQNLNDFPYVTAGGNQKVQSLELQERNIQNFPEGMNGFTLLSSLNLNSNSLGSIPDEIYEIQRLRILYLRENNITVIDKKIEDLQNLDYLHLGENQLTSLPNEITNLSSLKYLFLDNNSLIELPANFGELVQLVYLFVRANQLTSLPDISQLSNLLLLQASENNFNEIPNSILSLSSLESLSLGTNNISSITSAIGNLANLTNLSLEKNNIQALPLEMNSLNKLESLFLAENNIMFFPEQFTFPVLESLNLRDNPISIFPPNILGMSNLKNLQLADTDISSIPETISDLTELNFLFLGGNSLESLPSQMGDLTSLLYLGIGRNRLNGIPRELGNLSNLETLEISNNPFTIIPREVCDLVSTNNITFRKDANDMCE